MTRIKMKKLLLAILIILFVQQTFGQSKMIVGEKHTIFVEIPRNWIQAENEQLPFFIKPDYSNISNKTDVRYVSPNSYMYVYGIDYKGKPDMIAWINAENDYLLSEHPDLVIDTLNLTLDNIFPDDYSTGNYKILTYEYISGRQEVMLVVECESTIVTAVLSTEKSTMPHFSPAFIELCKSIKIMGSTLNDD